MTERDKSADEGSHGTEGSGGRADRTQRVRPASVFRKIVMIALATAPAGCGSTAGRSGASNDQTGGTVEQGRVFRGGPQGDGDSADEPGPVPAYGIPYPEPAPAPEYAVVVPPDPEPVPMYGVEPDPNPAPPYGVAVPPDDVGNVSLYSVPAPPSTNFDPDTAAEYLAPMPDRR